MRQMWGFFASWIYVEGSDTYLDNNFLLVFCRLVMVTGFNLLKILDSAEKMYFNIVI